MPDAYILAGARTPIGKFLGCFSSVPAAELGAVAIRASLARAGILPADVQEVILGMILTAGAGQAPARQAAIQAGLPPTVAALTSQPSGGFRCWAALEPDVVGDRDSIAQAISLCVKPVATRQAPRARRSPSTNRRSATACTC